MVHFSLQMFDQQTDWLILCTGTDLHFYSQVGTIYYY